MNDAAPYIAHEESVPPTIAWKLLLTVAGVLAFWAAMRIVFFEGLWGVDDLHHVRFAMMWDRIPANHWETRIPFNALLRLCFMMFGFSQAVAAIPSMLGSLMICCSGMWLSWHCWRSVRTVLLAGLLLACLPLDVLFSTTPNARLLASGLIAVGTAVFITRRGAASSLSAGFIMALAMWMHPFVVFFAVITLAAIGFVRCHTRFHVLIAMATLLMGFIIMDCGVNYLWSGDPLHAFRVMQQTHLQSLEHYFDARSPWTKTGGLDITFFDRPLQDLLASKAFGMMGTVAVLGLLLTRRKYSTPLKAIAISAILSWAWMSYGTQSPTKYYAFPGTVDYWQPLSLLLVLLVVDLLHRQSRTVVACAAIGLILIGILLCSVSGQWGQGVKSSEELLQYAKQHPEDAFVADDRTLQDFWVLNECKPLENVYSVPGSTVAHFATLDDSLLARRSSDGVRILTNRMTDRLFDQKSTQWVRQHEGPVVYHGPPRYRSIAYLLPESIRSSQPWLLRRIPFQIHRLRLDEPGLQ